MRRQLDMLSEGRHPTTGASLPPPVGIDPSEDMPYGLTERYRASETGRLYAATEQELNPRMRLMLERVRKRERDRIEAARCVRRRIRAKSHPSVCVGYEPQG